MIVVSISVERKKKHMLSHSNFIDSFVYLMYVFVINQVTRNTGII